MKGIDFYYKNNRLQQVKGFINVVRYGGVLRAAEQMGVVQSAVSTQVSSLEKDLKIKLFDRKSRKMILTPEGKRFYDFSIPFLQGFENLFEEFTKKENNDEENHLRIAAHQYIMIAYVPKWLAKLKKLYPNIKITLLNISKEEAIEKILSGQIDIAFYDVNPILHPELECIKIIEEPFVLGFNKNRTHLVEIKDTDITWDVICKEGLLITNTYWYKSMPKYFHTYDNNIEFELATYEAIKELIRYDLCVSFCPLSYIGTKDIEDGGRTKNISHLTGLYQSYIVIELNKTKKKIVTNLINVASE